MTQSKKLYVLDTNVLLYDPLILDTFRNGQIGIPIVVFFPENYRFLVA